MTPLVQLPETDFAERLTLDQSIRLKQLESEIGTGMRHFVVVGKALAEIRDAGLYRHHRTFEEYCEDRWQMTRQRGYQFIDAASVVENVNNCGQTLPANEAQARELIGLDRETQRQVWKRVVETAPDGRITAKHIAETIRQFKGEPAPLDEPTVWTLDDAVEHLGSWIYEAWQKWPQSFVPVLVNQLHSLANELETKGRLRS